MEQYLTLTNLSSVIVDVICILLFLAFAIICSKKGFCKCIMPIVVFVLSFVAAILGSRILDEAVTNIIYPLVNTKLTESLDSIILDLQSQNGILGLVLGRVDISSGVAKLSMAVTEEFVHIGLFIIILLLALLIFTLIGKVAGKITDLPVIRSLDSLLGFIYGLLQCFVLLFIAIHLCSMLNIDFFEKYAAGTRILMWLISL